MTDLLVFKISNLIFINEVLLFHCTIQDSQGVISQHGGCPGVHIYTIICGSWFFNAGPPFSAVENQIACIDLQFVEGDLILLLLWFIQIWALKCQFPIYKIHCTTDVFLCAHPRVIFVFARRIGIFLGVEQAGAPGSFLTNWVYNMIIYPILFHSRNLIFKFMESTTLLRSL